MEVVLWWAVSADEGSGHFEDVDYRAEEDLDAVENYEGEADFL